MSNGTKDVCDLMLIGQNKKSERNCVTKFSRWIIIIDTFNEKVSSSLNNQLIPKCHDQ